MAFDQQVCSARGNHNARRVQEERNADHLLEEGAALRSNNLPALAYKVQRLLDDPARLEAMKANVRRLARPDAARDIVRRLLELERSGAWGA